MSRIRSFFSDCGSLFFFLVTVFSTFVSCEDARKVRIKGEVEFATREYMVFGKLNPEIIRILDTVYLRDLRYFDFETKVDTPDYYTLDFGTQRVNVLLTEYDLEVFIEGNSPFGEGRIYGSPEETMLWNLKLFMDSLVNSDHVISMKSELRRSILENDNRAKDSIFFLSQQWRVEQSKQLIKFLQSYPINFGHLQGLTVLDDSLAREYKAELLMELKRKYPTSVNVHFAVSQWSAKNN